MAGKRLEVQIAINTLPHQVSLVPEKRLEITTEGGLDACSQEQSLRETRKRLVAHDIRFSLFLDPDPKQIDSARRIGAQCVEINTGRYSELVGSDEISAELEIIALAAEHAAESGLSVFAGHGLNDENVIAIAAIPEIEELNIGHYIVARSVFVGLEQAVKNMLASIDKGLSLRKIKP